MMLVASFLGSVFRVLVVIQAFFLSVDGCLREMNGNGNGNGDLF